MRLTQGEVKQLATDGTVEETVEFGSGKRNFVYAIDATDDVDTVHADYENDKLRVRLPLAGAKDWVNSDEVGIETELDELRILVEKDFACLKPRADEDESDMFPNPDPASC